MSLEKPVWVAFALNKELEAVALLMVSHDRYMAVKREAEIRADDLPVVVINLRDGRQKTAEQLVEFFRQHELTDEKIGRALKHMSAAMQNLFQPRDVTCVESSAGMI